MEQVENGKPKTPPTTLSDSDFQRRLDAVIKDTRRAPEVPSLRDCWRSIKKFVNDGS
jgi:hypothetical protein